MYKRIFIIIISTLFINQGHAKLSSCVDERIELTSIVFRLAEAEEYVNNNIPGYTKEIDQYFEKYKNHQLIKYTKQIRESNQIGYNAISSFAMQLIIENNRVKTNPKTDINKYFSKDNRWNEKIFYEYITLLDDFYRKTKFNYFFKQHKSLYTETTQRFDGLLNLVDTEWFPSFFGKPIEDALIIVSLCNGPHNYGGTFSFKDKQGQCVIIIGSPNADPLGVPVYNPDVIFPTIIHELCHHFSSPLVKDNKEALLSSANKIFPFVQKQMELKAYGNAETLIFENINMLFANMYFVKNPTGFEAFNISKDEERGFIWMRDAVSFMNNFTSNRQVYTTIEDFMPQIIGYMDYIAANIEYEVSAYPFRYPMITAVYPALNSTVSPDVKEIRVDFSHPMNNSMGMRPSSNQQLEGPDMEMGYWSEDGKSYILPVKLKKDKKYGFKLLSYVFSSENGYPMKNDFEIIFQTNK